MEVKTFYDLEINSKKTTEFGCSILDSSIDSPVFNTYNSEWLKGSLIPLYGEKKNTYKNLYITMIMYGSQEQVEKNISKLALEMKECILKFSHKCFFYKCEIDSIDNKEEFSFETYIVNFSCKVGEIFEMKIEEDFNSIIDFTVNNNGIADTPAIVEITPLSDLIDINLEGLSDDLILIKNLKANRTVILDGELQTVTVDGVNKYGDTDMWDFPSLSPGQNTIKVSKNNCNIKIKYKPRWI